MAVACYVAVISALWLRSARDGWRLVGDSAMVVLRAGDVFDLHLTPLRGMPSGFMAWSSAASPHHLGPGAFWVLAPSVAVFGRTETAALVGTWANAVACALIVAAVARRMSGARGARLALVAMLVTLISAAFYDLRIPVNPAPATHQLFALLVVSWALAAGRVRWLPVWAVLATLVVQADLAFVPTVGAVAIAVAWSARRTWPSLQGWAGSGLRRPMLATSAVLAVMWAPVLYQAATRDSGGNLRQLWIAGTTKVPIVGLASLPSAVRAVVWVTDTGLVGGGLARFAVPLAGVVCASFAWRAWRTLPRGRTVPLLSVVTGGLIGGIVGQLLVPSEVTSFGAMAYRVPLAVTAGFAWYALALGASARTVAPRTSRFVPGRLASVTVVALVIAVISVHAVLVGDRFAWYLAGRTERIDAIRSDLRYLPRGRYRWAPLGGPDATTFAHGIAISLIDRGIDLRVEGLENYFGPHRRVEGDEEHVLYLTFGDGGAPVVGATLLAEYRHRDPAVVERGAQVVAAVRDHPVVLAGPDPGYAIANAVAGSGAISPKPIAIHDRLLNEMAKGFEAHPDRIADLPAEAIVALADQGLVEVPGIDGVAGSLDVGSTVRVWSAPTP